MSGNAAIAGNGDVGTVTNSGVGLGFGLLVGTTLDENFDSFVFNNVTGVLNISILNYVRNGNSSTNRARTRFDLLIDGTRVDRINLSARDGDNDNGVFDTFNVDDATVELRIEGRRGEGDYDVAIYVTPVPAGLPLFATGLLGLGILTRRRRKS